MPLAMTLTHYILRFIWYNAGGEHEQIRAEYESFDNRAIQIT